MVHNNKQTADYLLWGDTMVFSSLVFLFIYLPPVLLIYHIVPLRLRNLFLLVVNLIFYGWGEPALILLMVFSTLVDYTHGYFIGKYRDKNKGLAKGFVISSIIINLSLLGFFKYAGFLTGVLNLLPFFTIPTVTIPLPIGISFYTFQTMSYSIDVYKGDAPAQKNIIAFGTYVSLFPQLIAGPIVRYKDISHQLNHRKETLKGFTQGVRVFIIGLAQKVLIANQMGLLWNNLNIASNSNGVLGNWIGIIAYTLQIYFDFNGYSLMACGLGNMLGFEFLKNFNYPYISQSITDFWHRWHISLSTWFKEYVYIPLGGNRKGTKRTIINLSIVWFLTGLWHGASWNFILWGMYFGMLLILEKFVLINFLKRLPVFLRHIYALVFILIGWIIFYFEDMNAMVSFMVNLVKPTNGIISHYALTLIISYLPLLLAACVASTPIPIKLFNKFKAHTLCWIPEAALTTIAMALCTASLVSQSYNPFLYFRF